MGYRGDRLILHYLLLAKRVLHRLLLLPKNRRLPSPCHPLHARASTHTATRVAPQPSRVHFTLPLSLPSHSLTYLASPFRLIIRWLPPRILQKPLKLRSVLHMPPLKKCVVRLHRVVYVHIFRLHIYRINHVLLGYVVRDLLQLIQAVKRWGQLTQEHPHGSPA